MDKYDNYKDSGIEWIGEIPEHWENIQIKHLAIGNNTLFLDGDWIESKEIIYDNGDYRYITTGNIGEGKYKEQGNTYITQETFEKLNCTEVVPDDLLISRLNPPIGRSCLVPDLGNKIVTSVDNVILRPSPKYIKNYLVHFFTNTNYFEYTSLVGRGATMQRISRSMLGDIKIALPPTPEEQTTIANYLDRKTAEIDELIADKKRLLELYGEEKNAIINQAVTKGINPNAPMKDSGIEWLGEIPEQWEVKNLRYLCKITTGGKDTENREDDGEFPFFVRSQTVEKISTYSYDGEAILTAGDGVGVCKVWHHIIGKFDFHQRVYMMYDFDGILGSYLFHYMKENFIHDVLKKSAKSTVDSLRRPMFLEFAVAFPKSEDEQKEIVQYIENEITRIDSKTEITKKLIDLLTEYRTALISEVVTGKIKVTE